MSLKEDVLRIIDNSADLRAAAEKIYRGSKDTAIYVILVGLERISQRADAAVRRQMRRTVINPQFVKGRTYGSVKRTRGSIRRAAAAARDLFVSYKIAGISIGLYTKEQLIEQAVKERASAKGHLRVAVWYEALAEPMANGQTVKDYWVSEEAIELIREEIWMGTEDKDVKFE